MTPRARRLRFALLILGVLGASAGIALYALRDSVTYFHPPSEVLAKAIPPGRVFRLGGLVAKGSVKTRGADMAIAFDVTDGPATLRVEYAGILPDLFREGQGVVATGALDNRGVFVAREILAKHDENYMPPEVARALKK